MTALQKLGGGVRGIVAGALSRERSHNCWAKPWRGAQSFSMRTRHESMMRVRGQSFLQALSGVDPESAVLSIDGISAYDLVSRRAMLSGLARVEGGKGVLPFVKLFLRRTPSVLVGRRDGRRGSSTKGAKAKGASRGTQ